MAHFLLITFILLSSPLLIANSCCGQSPASFTVLSLEQRLSLSTSLSYIESQGRVFEDSREFWFWDGKKRQVQALGLNVASSIAHRQQFFVNLSLLNGHYKDSNESGTATNLSDTLIGYNYEIFPEYSFSYWKPIVYITALVNLPTGNSIYDSVSLSEGTDVSGHNQWGTGLGVTLKKIYFPWTLTLQGRSIYLIEKQFETLKVSGFYDSSAALLISYASQWFGLQLNSGVTFSHLSQRKISPSGTISGVSQNWSVLFGVQRPISDSTGIGINYSDQTILGPAKNSLLNRSIALNFNYNSF